MRAVRHPLPTSAELRRARELEALRANRDQRYRDDAAFIVRQVTWVIVWTMILSAPHTAVIEMVGHIAGLAK